MLVPLNLTWVWPDTLVLILVTVVAGVVGRWLIGVLIRRGVRSSLRSRSGDLLGRAGWRGERHEQRTRTVGDLLGSTTTAVIAVIVVTTVMGLIGVPLTPFLASAGIGGVALGFGAQSLVKDFISGVFMILEDQFGVGDTVVVGTITGTVEAVGLRVTRLRDAEGRVWYLRNGNIDTVGNLSQADAVVQVDIPVHWSADPAQVQQVLAEAVGRIDGLPVSEPPEVLGAEVVAGNAQTFRIQAHTAGRDRGEVARRLRAAAMAALQQHDIKGPF